MSANSCLEGLTVLVMEDDFLQADDARAALEEAGAAVIGPFAAPAATIEALKQQQPECAILDVHVMGGRSFEAALVARALGIPVVLATGYQLGKPPPELAGAVHLRKPVQSHELVDAVLRAMAGNGCAPGRSAGPSE
jgi:FixJ family two-component response regulator